MIASPRDVLINWLSLACIVLDAGNGNIYRASGEACEDMEQVTIAVFESGEIVEYHLDAHLLASGHYTIYETRRDTTLVFDSVPDIARPDVVHITNHQDKNDLFAINSGNDMVSAAWSIRRNATAAEVAVETNENYRRRGFGKQVVSAWVAHQLSLQRMPIYSHRSGNLESAALVKSLGAARAFRTISYRLRAVNQ